jgi:hypothetical protein
MNGYKACWKDTNSENFPGITLSTTNPSNAGLKLNPGLRGDKLQLNSGDGKDRSTWSYLSTFHTSSLRGAHCNTDIIHISVTSCSSEAPGCRLTSQSAVTWDSRHLKWDSVVLCMHSPRCVSQVGSQLSALLTVRLNIAAVGTSFRVTDSTDIDFSKHPLTTIDITEQGPSFLFGQCTSKASDVQWRQSYGWQSHCSEVSLGGKTGIVSIKQHRGAFA